MIGEVGHRYRALHQGAVYRGGEEQGPGVLPGLHHNVELNVPHGAGGGEEAQVPREEAVEGELLPLIGEEVGPQLPLQGQDQTGAVLAAPGDQGALGEKPLCNGPGQGIPLGLSELPPEGEIGSDILVCSSFSPRGYAGASACLGAYIEDIIARFNPGFKTDRAIFLWRPEESVKSEDIFLRNNQPVQCSIS